MIASTESLLDPTAPLAIRAGEEILLRVEAHGPRIRVSAEGLNNAIHFSLRLVFLVMGSSVMTLTTPPVTLTDGLESLVSPLKVIKFPAHEMAMMMTIALRFIPTLAEEADKIMKAQSARGADFTSGSLRQRAKALIPLLVPLFVSAFRRAGDLAMAMESRCYRGGEGRTKLHILKAGRRDLFAALSPWQRLQGQTINQHIQTHQIKIIVPAFRCMLRTPDR